MKRLLSAVAVLALALSMSVPVLAQSRGPQVRAVHASPDAPAVDVWVDGNIAFQNAPFKGVTPYAELSQGMHNIQVVPSGATEPVVIEADLDLQSDTDYTIVAVGLLANIEPLVLVDNNGLPAQGKAHVRFVHASPDAPAVDIAVTGGPVLFGNIPFKGVGDYLPVDAGTYNLEARIAGTQDVALSLPGITLQEGTVYTVYAMGLAGGEPALTAAISVDAARTPGSLLPATGNEAALIVAGLFSAGLALVGLGYILSRPEPAKVRVKH
jgi:hypothetical protein